MRRPFKIILVSLGILSGLFVSGLLYLAQAKPELWLNAFTLRWASLHLLEPLGVKLSFDTLDLSFERDDFWQRHVRLSTEGFHFHNEAIDLDLGSLAATFSFDLHPKHLAVTKFGPLVAKGLRMQLRLPEEPPAQLPATAADTAASDQAFWRNILWVGPFTVDSQQLVLQSGKNFARLGPSELQVQTPLPQHFQIQGKLSQGGALWDGQTVRVPQLDLTTELVWDGHKAQLLRFGPLTAEHMEADLHTPPSDPQASNSSWTFADIYQLIEQVELKPITLDFSRLSYKEPKSPLQGGAVRLTLEHPQSQQWLARALGQKLQGLPVRDFRVDLATTLADPSLASWSLKLSGSAQSLAWGRLLLDGSLQKKAQSSQFAVQARTQGKPQQFHVKAEGFTRESQFEIRWAGGAKGLHASLPSLELSPCLWSGRWQGSPLDALSMQIACQLKAERQVFAEESTSPVPLPKSFAFSLNGPLRLTQIQKNPLLDTEIVLTMPRFGDSLYQIGGNLRAKAKGPLQDLSERSLISVEGEAQAEVPSFQKLVNALKHSPWEVPAPLHSLDGPLGCQLALRYQGQKTNLQMPVTCQSQLASPSQSLRWTATADLHMREQDKPLIAVDVILEQIQLQLPKIALGDPIPQVLSDKRFGPLVPLTESSTSGAFDWQLHIHTPPEHPVLVVTQLLKEPVPITIDLQTSSTSAGTQGRIAVQNYQLHILKKKAFVESLGIELADSSEAPQLFGTLHFEDPDTKIALKLAGTLDRPFYLLESQPPRPTTELLSMILYGGRTDAMNDENLRSIEETRAAMIDGAIGLVSMFYLASTPIDSVGYNPHTGVFRARVQLGQGTSLFVGSDLEGAKQSIGLRRRLSENWSFETGAETSEAEGKNKGLAMFRWGRRY